MPVPDSRPAPELDVDPAVLTPMPAPERLPEGTAVLDGPGSVAPERLRADLERSFEQAATEQDSHRPALVVSTSGSTGAPKRTVLGAGALTASGRATEAVCASEGAQWLLALPVHYVAGAQVIARSVLAGTTPETTDSVRRGGSFSAADFLARAEALHAGPRMTSLVPTQVHDLLEAAETGLVPEDELLDALRSFRAVLLGGAPASADLLARAEDLGLPLVLTYGSAETSGGCVYDARALPGVRLGLERADREPGDAPGGETEVASADAPQGRIWLGGPVLASGYLGDVLRTGEHFRRDPEGRPWYRTDDVGSLDADGRLRVHGRADDVVITGGVKVSARAVAACLEKDPAVREALVVGVPSPRWGQEIRAAVSRRPGAAPDPEALAGRVREELGTAAAPKRTVVLERLPQTSTGKPDRAAVLRLLRG